MKIAHCLRCAAHGQWLFECSLTSFGKRTSLEVECVCEDLLHVNQAKWKKRVSREQHHASAVPIVVCTEPSLVSYMSGQRWAPAGRICRAWLAVAIHGVRQWAFLPSVPLLQKCRRHTTGWWQKDQIDRQRRAVSGRLEWKTQGGREGLVVAATVWWEDAKSQSKTDKR